MEGLLPSVEPECTMEVYKATMKAAVLRVGIKDEVGKHVKTFQRLLARWTNPFS